MQGVTTALVLFVFACVLFPRLIDNRPQYYVGFVCVLLIIVLDAVANLLGGSADARGVLYLGIAVLQVAAIVLLFLSAGGLTVRGLTREMAGAFEVVRRGEKTKEVIIPIGGGKSGEGRKRAVDTIGEPLPRVDLDAETGGGGGGAAYPARKPAAPPPPAKTFDDDEDGPIPMD